MRIRIILVVLMFSVIAGFPSFAETTYSEYWKQDANGAWYVQKPDGTKVTNAWLCDDAVPANGKDVWYLLDANGQMISAGIVQDGTGNFYSIETGHNGYYGMLRYRSGNYGGVDLALEGSHNGAFAAILNRDGIDALKAQYGLTSVANISNANCVYTSSFGKSSTSGGGRSSGASSTQKTTGGTLTKDDIFNGAIEGVWVAQTDLANYAPAYQKFRIYAHDRASDAIMARWIGCKGANGFVYHNRENDCVTQASDPCMWASSDSSVQMNGTTKATGITICFLDEDTMIAEIRDYLHAFDESLPEGVFYPGITVIYEKDLSDHTNVRDLTDPGN